ncbi:MAG TPA: BTAD domain-containing putative transcriptional regulator [Methylomirabilota bacterium]
MTQLRLTLLGGFQARLHTGEVMSLPGRKAQALLAFLALPLGRAHPRDKLAALLWGGIREESARASLRQTLFVVRKALGEAEGVVLRQEGEALALAPGVVEADVAVFERAVADGTPEALERAAALYQGDLLAGLVLAEAPFEEWLLGERERLRELALEALARLLAHQRKSGAVELAAGTGLRLLALDPLQEAVHRALMRLYADLGRRGTALRQYQQCVGVLGRELGIEPEPETKALYQEILRERPQHRGAIAESLPAQSGAEPRAPGAEPPLIGRADDLARLRDLLAAAAGGAGQVVAVLGEGGIGKSRLVSELAGDAARRGVTVLLGRSYGSEQILPFGPWVDALRAGRIAEDADLLERLGPTLRSGLARLLPEAGGSAPAGGTTDIRQIFESVARLLGQLAGRQPLLVVLEDLHWADEVSARLVAFVGRRLADRPVLMVATAREDELADAPAFRQALDDLRRDRGLTTLTLRPLSRPDTLALVRTVARGGDAAADERLGEQAWAASEGNPFVAVETVRAHAEGAAIAPGHGLALPERVRDIVGRRLERLSERSQTLAAVAAAIGREFDFALLQRAGGLGEEDTAAGFEELVRRRVLHGVGERFDFTHDRIREVAYERILAPRRRILHRKVAEAIEALHGADLDAHALALGQHYRQAGAWEPAVTYLWKAGLDAWTRGANRESVACFESALSGLEHLADGPAKTGLAIDIRIDLELALMGLGEIPRGFERLREAEALALRAGDRRRLGRVYFRMTYDLGSLGDLAAALARGEQALAIAAEEQDPRTLSGSVVVVARTLYGLGQYRRAIEVARRNEDIVLTGGPKLPPGNFVPQNVAFSRGWIVLAMAEVGEFRDGALLGEEAVRIARAELGPHLHVWALLGLGRLYVVQGALERGIEILEQALPLCQTSGDLAVYFSRTASSLGEAYARSGRLAEGLALLQGAANHGEAIGFAYSHALVLGILGSVHLLAGDVEAAGRCAVEALALARRYGQRGWEAWALRLLGEVAARRDRLDLTAVETHLREAMVLAGEREMQPLLTHCRLGLGEAYRRAGDRARARTEAAGALAEYRALDMPHWQARAEAVLAGQMG